MKKISILDLFNEAIIYSVDGKTNNVIWRKKNKNHLIIVAIWLYVSISDFQLYARIQNTHGYVIQLRARCSMPFPKAIASLGGVAFATVAKAAVSRYTVFILNEN